MDELSQRFGEILKDPQSMEKVRQMASRLLGEEEAEKPEAAADPTGAALSSLLPEGTDVAKLVRMLTRLQNRGPDSREQLLIALRPHLTPERKKRVDQALRILKLLDLAPLLSDSGILG